MGTIRDGENVLGEVFEHTNYGTCSTLASEQIKEVYCPLFRYYIGARISIKFTNGNTAGTCVGTDSNVIDPLTAPKISLNGQTHTIYVGGEPAGEGFINSGDVHDFVFDGENWADITADVIYKGGDSDNGYYEKARNGELEQSGKKSTGFSSGVQTITLPIPYNDTDFMAYQSLNYGTGSGYLDTVVILSNTQIKISATIEGTPRPVSWLTKN